MVPLRVCGQMLTKLIMVVQACAQAGTQPNQRELSQLPFMGCLRVLSTPYVYIISFNPHHILHWLYYSHFTGKETEAQWSEEISQRYGVGSGGTKGCLSNSLVTESQKCHQGVRRYSQGALFHTWGFHTCKHYQKMQVPKGTMQPGTAPSHSRGPLDQGLLHTSGGPSVVTKTEPGKCPGPSSALASLSSRWGSCWGCASRNMILHKACLSALWGRNNPRGLAALRNQGLLVFSKNNTSFSSAVLFQAAPLCPGREGKPRWMAPSQSWWFLTLLEDGENTPLRGSG